MKAISLHQPWASLWLTDAKIHETRHWAGSHRGLLYVHAAKRLESHCGSELDEICIDKFGAHWRQTLPRGAVIGIVDLIDCLSTNGPFNASTTHAQDLICGNWAPGRFAWRRGANFSHVGPWPYRGQQGIWDISDDEMDAIANRSIQGFA